MTGTPTQAGTPWISVATAAELLHITEGSLRERLYRGEFVFRYVPGPGQGGKIVEISLPSLPEGAQLAYYERLAPARAEEIGAGLDGISARERQKILERLAILEAWKGFLADNRTQGDTHKLSLLFVAAWNKAHEPRHISESTLYRWDERFREFGPAGLAPQYGKTVPKGKITERLEAEFLALYLDQNRPSIAHCVDKLERKAWALGWPEAVDFPSKKTFERLVKRIPQPVLTLRREGEKAYQDKCEPSILRDYTGLKPNDFWVADHHQFDVAVLGPDGKVYFPWLTAWMDVRSRRLNGWYISLNPNSDTVLLSFLHAVERCNGSLPWHVLFDNGKDYRCIDIAGGRTSIRVTLDPARITPVMSLLEIDVINAEPYNAKAKPIERAFRTIEEGFSRLFLSYRGGNVLKRPERLKDVLANPGGLITLEEFRERFADWIDADYNERGHRGQGMNGRCPREVYNSLLTTVRRAAPEALRLALMRTTKPLIVQRHGIWYFDRWFRSDELMLHQGEKVHVRYHPDKVGLLYVYDLQDRFICQVESRELVAWGATAEDIRAAKSEKKRLRRLAEQYFAGQSAVAAEPDHAKRVIDRRKAAQAGQPQVKPDPKVIEPVRIDLKLPKRLHAQTCAETAAPPVDIASITKAKAAAQKAAQEAERLKQEEQERLILSRLNAKAK